MFNTKIYNILQNSLSVRTEIHQARPSAIYVFVWKIPFEDLASRLLSFGKKILSLKIV